MIISDEEECLITNLKRMLILQKPHKFLSSLSDLSKILDVRTLHWLEKGLNWKRHFEKEQKMAVNFSGRCSRTTSTPSTYATELY